jgi:hypothetical protein
MKSRAVGSVASSRSLKSSQSNAQHFDIATRPHIGGAPCLFEDPDLAENFPVAKRGQGHVRALRRMSHHLHLTVGDDVAIKFE